MKLGMIIFSHLFVLSLIASAQPTITPVFVPRYFAGTNTRVPNAIRVTINGLTPNATYRFYNTGVNNISDHATSNGAGNPIFANSTGFYRSSNPRFTAIGHYDSFIANGNGSATAWMVLETVNNTRFTVAGSTLGHRVMLNNGAGGNTVTNRVTAFSGSDSVRVMVWGNSTTPSSFNCTGLYGVLPATGSGNAQDFVLTYNNVNGTGQPLTMTYVESEGYANAQLPPTFYTNFVQGVTRAFGMAIPNFDTVRRVDVRSYSTGALIRYFKDADGLWPSGTSLRSPTGGAVTPRVLNSVDFATSLNVNAGGAVPHNGTKDFGTQIVSTQTNITFTISNTSPGNSPVSIGSITGTNSSDFMLVGPNPTSIDGFDGVNAATATFTIRFTPTGFGIRTASFSFTSLDITNATYTIHLSGTGASYTTGITVSGVGNWTPDLPTDPNTDHKRPVDLSFTGSDTPDQVTVQYQNSAPVPQRNPFPNGIQRYWSITQSGGTSWTTNLVLRFTAAEDPFNNRVGNLTVARSTDGGVHWLEVGNTFTTTANGNAWEVTIPNVTQFSIWAMGGGPILPVELSSFSAVLYFNGVRLNWVTQSEISNLGFTISRKNDSSTNTVRTYFVPSLSENGTSSSELNYSFFDNEELESGTHYTYSISEVDLDGTQRQLRSARVLFESQELPSEFGLLRAYPNPFNPSTKVRVLVRDAGMTTIALYNVQGQLVKEIYAGFLTNEVQEFSIDGSQLSSGLYILRAQQGNRSTLQKLVLSR